MTPPSPSLSSSSTRCLLVAMVTSPSVPPYGEAGRLEDILEKKREKEDRKDRQRERGENSEQYSKDDIRGWMELHDSGDG